MSQEEIEIEAIGIEVSEQPVELYKVLKIANAVSGGGEAKMAITEGYVIVNGEVETRKRCKIYDGDLIAFNEEFYVLVCDTPPLPIAPREKKAKPAAKQNTNPKSAKPAKTKPQPKQSPQNKKAQKNSTVKGKKDATPSVKAKREQTQGEIAPNGRKQISF